MHSSSIATAVTDSALYCEERGWACERVLDATGNERLASIAGWIGEKPLEILAILVAAWLANWLLRRVIARTIDRMMDNADRLGGYMPTGKRQRAPSKRTTARAQTLSSVGRSVATGIVIVIAFTSVLSILGVSVAAIFASAGIAGVALGFGAQNLVRDVLAGWFILVEDRYGVGDTIDAGPPAVGVVERVTLRSTRLRDINGTVWHVANGEIVRVGNKSQNWSRAVVDVVVTPTADVDRACEILAEVGEEMLTETTWDDRMTGEVDVLGVHLIDPNGVTLRVVCETEPASQFQVEREFRKRVLRAFEAEGIPLAVLASLRPDVEGDPTGP